MAKQAASKPHQTPPQGAARSDGGANPGLAGANLGGTTGGAVTGGQLDKVSVLGHVLWLMTQSPPHKHIFVSDFEWLVIPAVSLGQFRIWRERNQQGVLVPVAYASWAYLDEATEERIKQNIKKLAPIDWKSGDNLWLIDLIAPFGGGDRIVKELKEKAWGGRTVKSLQPSPAGGVAVMEW